MTAVLDAKHKTIGCPHCQGKINVEVEQETPTVKVGSDLALKKVEELDAFVREKLAKKEEHKDEKPAERFKVVYPAYQPRELCKGKDCEGHKNENYTVKISKKCDNCDQFSPESAKKCPWCGQKSFTDIEDEDLDDLGIPKPEHDHEE